MTAKDRILQYIDFHKFSRRQFSENCGFSNAIWTKRNAIGSDNLEKIAINYPDLSMDWVITGKGEMIKEIGENEVLLQTKKTVATDINQTKKPLVRDEKYYEILDNLVEAMKLQSAIRPKAVNE